MGDLAGVTGRGRSSGWVVTQPGISSPTSNYGGWVGWGKGVKPPVLGAYGKAASTKVTTGGRGGTTCAIGIGPHAGRVMGSPCGPLCTFSSAS